MIGFTYKAYRLLLSTIRDSQFAIQTVAGYVENPVGNGLKCILSWLD